jgi:two-component system, OmpR family, aerobic respiration control sensor histidine kinase ArcB
VLFLEKVKDYIQKDWSQIEKLAHKIKGGKVYIRTRRFQYACQYLERYFKAGHRSQLDKRYHLLLPDSRVQYQKTTV